MRAIQKVKNVCTYSLCVCFVAADHWFLVFSVMLNSCLMQFLSRTLSCGSAEIAVAVPIENPADCEVRGVIRFLQANEILFILPKRQALTWNCSAARQWSSAYCPADIGNSN